MRYVFHWIPFFGLRTSTLVTGSPNCERSTRAGIEAALGPGDGGRRLNQTARTWRRPMSTSPVAEARSLEDDGGCALSHVGPSGTHPPDLGREAASGWRPTKPRLKSGRAGPSRIQRPRPSITGACVKPLACRKRRRALCARGSARLTVVSVVRQARSQRVPACSRARERVRRMKRAPG